MLVRIKRRAPGLVYNESDVFCLVCLYGGMCAYMCGCASGLPILAFV